MLARNLTFLFLPIFSARFTVQILFHSMSTPPILCKSRAIHAIHASPCQIHGKDDRGGRES